MAATVSVFDLDGARLGVIPKHQGVTREYVMGRASGDNTLTLPADSEWLDEDLLARGKTEGHWVLVESDLVEPWMGYVMGVEGEVRGGAVSLRLGDVARRLDKAPTAWAQFADTAGNVAAQLLDVANGYHDTRVRMAADYYAGGAALSRTYSGTSLLSALEELARDTAQTWEIVVDARRILGVLHWRGPFYHRDMTEEVLLVDGHGGNVMSGRWTVDYDSATTALALIGAAVPNQARPVAHVVSHAERPAVDVAEARAVQVDARPATVEQVARAERRAMRLTVGTQRGLEGVAEAHLRDRLAPHRGLSLTVLDRPAGLWALLRNGDVVRVSFAGYAGGRFEGTARVLGRRVREGGGDSMELALQVWRLGS